MSVSTVGNFLTKGCSVIAEIGQAHDGSLGNAHAYVDAVARTGATAIKFQTHIASAESTLDEPWRVRFSPQDETRYEYWRRMEFTAEQWDGLARHARDNGLIFLSSPFSPEAIELLLRIGIPAWKVASGEITNIPMLEAMASTGLPILLSSGMSSWGDLDRAVEVVREGGSDVVVMQCTTQYPCPPERVGLNLLGEIEARYGCRAGLSDHSGTIFPSLAAATLGAAVVEVHTVFSKDCFGPDTPASVTIDELDTLVRGVNFITTSLAAPVSKDDVAEEMQELRTVFGRSLVAAHNLTAGQIVTVEDVAMKKPGGGLPPTELAQVVGRKLSTDVRLDERLRPEMFK